MNDNIDYCHHDSKTLNTNYYQVLNGGRSSGKTFQTINMYEQKYKKLQSNWNSLREWLEERNKITKENSSRLTSKYDGSPLTRDFYEAVINVQAERKDVLDKMNELEGVDKDENN